MGSLLFGEDLGERPGPGGVVAGPAVTDGGDVSDDGGTDEDGASAPDGGDARDAGPAGSTPAPGTGTVAETDRPVPNGGSDGPTDDGDGDPVHTDSMRGTFVLVLVFFGAFVASWALNWFLLSQLWGIGP